MVDLQRGPSLVLVTRIVEMDWEIEHDNVLKERKPHVVAQKNNSKNVFKKIVLNVSFYLFIQYLKDYF